MKWSETNGMKLDMKGKIIQLQDGKLLLIEICQKKMERSKAAFIKNCKKLDNLLTVLQKYYSVDEDKA